MNKHLYIKPAIDLIEIEDETILAGSGEANGVVGGGEEGTTDQEGNTIEKGDLDEEFDLGAKGGSFEW